MNYKKIPKETAAKVIFFSDRTCCVCRNSGKHCQIHHIDSNENNNNIANLCLLCLDCHVDTQIEGGFYRKLTAEQIILYRDDWHKLVAQKRFAAEPLTEKEPQQSNLFSKKINIEKDIFKKQKDYLSLVILYETIEDYKSRDKYIELAIKNKVSDSTLVFLRGLQNKINLIPEETKKRLISSQIRHKDWSQLARTHITLNNHKEAIKSYFRSIIEDLGRGNLFSAAYYLKELSEEKIYRKLFEEDYEIRKKKRDLWWQIRCLEELGRDDEADNLLLKNKEAIENSDNCFLKEKLYLLTNEEDKLLKTIKHKKIRHV